MGNTATNLFNDISQFQSFNLPFYFIPIGNWVLLLLLLFGLPRNPSLQFNSLLFHRHMHEKVFVRCTTSSERRKKKRVTPHTKNVRLKNWEKTLVCVNACGTCGTCVCSYFSNAVTIIKSKINSVSAETRYTWLERPTTSQNGAGYVIYFVGLAYAHVWLLFARAKPTQMFFFCAG